MAVKRLAPRAFSRANATRPAIASSPVSKIRAKVFSPSCSWINFDFIALSSRQKRAGALGSCRGSIEGVVGWLARAGPGRLEQVEDLAGPRAPLTHHAEAAALEP